MNTELKLHIRKLQNRAIFSLIAILLTFISIVFGILFLFVTYFVAIILFAIAAFCIFFLIYSKHIVKKESKEKIYNPVVFNADHYFSFEELINIFVNLTADGNPLSTSEDVWFFRLSEIFGLRIVLYRTASFNKKDYDNHKNRINKKANKELNISQWVNRFEAIEMMRFNIVYTDTLNDELYRFISRNAARNLTRVEGIINIAIIGNKIMLPPIYGECDLAEISRYKDTIEFINQVLLNKE